MLLENDQCNPDGHPRSTSSNQAGLRSEDACVLAPRVSGTDSPCYNGGSCISTSTLPAGSGRGSPSQQVHQMTNYSCLCPPGFAGSLCEVNIDDCAEHQCQNGAMCVDGVNSYRCVCRDPTTSGEFCEQLNSYATSSANSIAPMALPIVAAPPRSQLVSSVSLDVAQTQPQQILARSADLTRPPVELGHSGDRNCKRITNKRYYEDGNGCQSVRMLKLSECAGTCGTIASSLTGTKKGRGEDPAPTQGCCLPSKVKRKRVRMQCTDGASYVKTVELIKRCSCSSECPIGGTENFVATSSDWTYGTKNQQQQQNFLAGSAYNASQEEQLMQITRLDAVD